MSPLSPRVHPGTAIGPYVVDRAIARDPRNSALFLANDARTRQPAVVRLVPQALLAGQLQKRLLREARALTALEHPGIARVLGAGPHPAGAWVATELVRGTDLRRMVRERGNMTPERALRWIEQAADALAAAHAVGVVHRDLGPSCLIALQDGRLKLVDFGTPSRGDMPTDASYLAPEQLEHGLADERSDVWALGCVLYELCVGNPPFGRGGAASLAAAILRHEPVFPTYLPASVTHVVSGCLRKSSFARIGSARELAQLARSVLAALTGEAPVTAAPVWHLPEPYSSSFPPARPSEPPGPAAPPVRPSERVRAVARTGRVKGAALRAALVWYASVYGEPALRAAFRKASPSLASILREGDVALGIMPSGWYDALCVGELVELLEKGAAPEDADAYTDAITLAVARDNVHGIYRSLFKLVASPGMLEANGQRVWRTYVDEGTLAVRFPTPGEMEVAVSGWTQHHPALCRVGRFMVQNCLREAGYNALVVERIACVSAGDPACVFEGLYLP